MQPIVVRMELKTPLGGSSPTLDALLAALLFERTGSVERAHSEIPLAKTGELWHASSGLVEDAKRTRAMLTASLRTQHDLKLEWLARGRGNVPPRMSETRRREFGNVQSPIRGWSARAVWWFAEGNPGAVHELLKGVEFVAKKNTSGFGQVVHLDVEPGRLNGLYSNWTPGTVAIANDGRQESEFYDHSAPGGLLETENTYATDPQARAMKTWLVDDLVPNEMRAALPASLAAAQEDAKQQLIAYYKSQGQT